MYSYNNPLNYTDPSGHTPVVDDCDFFGDCTDSEGGSGRRQAWGNDIRIDPVSKMYRSGFSFGQERDPYCGTADDNWTCYHPGEDVFGGKTIVAPLSGNVYFLIWRDETANGKDGLGGYGYFAIVEAPLKDGSGRNIYHILAHMESDNEFGIEQGSYVTVGTPLGIIGDTGASQGNHLHWEIRVNDPENFKLNVDENRDFYGFTIDEATLVTRDQYYPRYEHQLETYWIAPYDWANTKWDTPYVPFAP